MKAAVLFERGASGLRLVDVPDPEPAPGEAVMRVRASSLNRVDLYMRDNGAGISHQLPLILGVDGVGEIVEASPGTGLAVGARVMLYSLVYCGHCRFCDAGDHPLCLNLQVAGEHRAGCFSEYIAMPARNFLPLPDALGFDEAGAVPTAYSTAWRMLFGKRRLSPGETLLIVGIGGGVALACLQLALLTGARVFVTSSSDEKLVRAVELGAEAGINYRTEAVVPRILDLTRGEGVDMVVDSVGQASWADSLRALRRGGRIVTCGATTGSNPPVEIQRMFIRQLEVYGSTGASLDEFRAMLALFESGRLVPFVDAAFALDELGPAMRMLEQGEQFGKIGIRIGSDL
jgi:NADPH:quinone reductase-like Zn-dependent oxidoreductase